MKTKIIFRKKSSYQKKNCINRNSEHYCPNKSTIEAVCSKGANSAAIRCCENRKCKKVASDLALLSIS